MPKYNLKQEFEMPEYDFCYCDTCVAFENYTIKPSRK
jgi:hypothetical protein